LIVGTDDLSGEWGFVALAAGARGFLDDVGALVEQEARAWAFEFNAQSGELSELMRSLPSNLR
jgi:hypothetical protein